MTRFILWRAGGFLLGAGLSLTAVLSWRIPSAQLPLGADVRVVSLPTGELEVAPSGLVLKGTNLVPGTATGARGRMAIRNQTGALLAVRVRLVPATPDLDGLLRVRLATGENVVTGTLGQLRTWSAPVARLAPGEAQDLRLRAWIPPGVGDGYRGRLADVRLRLHSRRAVG